MNPARVRQFLANPKEQEKVKGMKWILGMMSKGENAAEFFADVVKVVVCKQVFFLHFGQRSALPLCFAVVEQLHG